MDEELKEKLNSWFDRPRWISKNCEATRLFTFLAKEGYVVVKKEDAEHSCSVRDEIEALNERIDELERRMENRIGWQSDKKSREEDR